MSGRFSQQILPVRRAGPRAADSPAPEAAAPSRHASGAGYSVITMTVPNTVLVLHRLVGAHDGIEDPGELFSRLLVQRAEDIGIAALADATPCEREGREGMPLGAFPLPQGPP